MYRDPKAFRERFKAWKNGQLVYLSGRPTELPLYEDGKDNKLPEGFLFDTEMPELVVSAKRKYIAGYDKNGNPVYTTDRTKSMSYEGVRQSESKYQRWVNRDKNASKYTDPIIKAAQIGIGAPLAVITGAPIAKAVSSGVGAAAKALVPGSSFWMNPITKQMVTGTAMSEGVNLANKAVSGYNTIGEGVGDLVQRATGWNPNNTWLGPLVTEAFNPGWYISPNGVMNTVGRVGGVAKQNLKSLTNSSKAFYKNLTMDLNSVPGVYYHGSPNRNINEFIPGRDGGIYFTPSKKAARGYTGTFGTGRVYEAKLDLGDASVIIDAEGKPWTAIPDDYVARGFNMPKEEVYSILGNYNAGAQKWYEDFLTPFGYKPKNYNYAIDQVVKLGKETGKSSVIIKNAEDTGKGLFGGVRGKKYDQVVVYDPNQISLLPSETPTITTKNAASITPEQWTAAQDAAIARGDMAEAQRLRDLHFKVSAPNTKVVDGTGNPQLVIHKTPNDFTVFDNSRSIGNLNWAATPKAFEGENGVFATGAGTSPKEMRLYVNMKNPHYPTIDEGMEPAFINEGEDGILGIVDKDMTDFYRSASDAGEGFNMSLGVDNPYALKSADAVTYDNKGVRIPLGKRDNFGINDIRYSLLPFVGVTGAAASLKNYADGKESDWLYDNPDYAKMLKEVEVTGNKPGWLARKELDAEHSRQQRIIASNPLLRIPKERGLEIVSPEFDLAMSAGLIRSLLNRGANKMASRYLFSAKSKKDVMPPLSKSDLKLQKTWTKHKEAINKEFNDFYHSEDYARRMTNAGLTEAEKKSLLKELDYTNNNSDYNLTTIPDSEEGFAVAGEAVRESGWMPKTNIKINPHYANRETLVHEKGHSTTANLESWSNGEGMGYPTIQKAMRYNASISPMSDATLIKNSGYTPAKLLYLMNEQEGRARAMQIALAANRTNQPILLFVYDPNNVVMFKPLTELSNIYRLGDIANYASNLLTTGGVVAGATKLAAKRRTNKQQKQTAEKK